MGIVNLTRALLLAAPSMLAPLAAGAAASLVMVEQAGCAYCARWNAEIAPIWPKTDEGRRAPLRRVDIHALPADITFVTPPRLTPTFVLVDEGSEVARIEGYAGDEFFWAMTARMMDEAGLPPAPPVAADRALERGGPVPPLPDSDPEQ